MTDEIETSLKNVEARLLALAKKRTFRFRKTLRRDAESVLRRMTTFVGYSDAEIAALERSLGVRLPETFRGYLRHFGKARGDLFRGSDVTPAEMGEYKQAALELRPAVHEWRLGRLRRLPLPSGLQLLLHRGR